MLVIGLTGGIASGKSTIARMMTEHGVLHIDADAIVHQLMQEPEIVREIAARFPSAVMNGSIDRQALGACVTADAGALTWLESMLHPRVRAREETLIAQARNEHRKAVVLDVPLLFESGAHALCDVVIAVSAPLEIRKQRAFARAGMTEEKFQRLVSRQMDETARNAKADMIIPTDQELDFTREQLELFLRERGIA